MPINWLMIGMAATLLGACQQGVTVGIDQTQGMPNFSVTRAGAEKPACVDDLSVYAGEAEGDPVWHVAAADDAPCTSRFRFAAVPPGFAADDDGKTSALQAGSRYTVVASGKGFIGGETFVAATSSR